MFISELFESVDSSNLLVVYPGRFQPFHKGHKSVYEYLTSEFGSDNVFIATSNKVDPPRSPFNFAEKTQFMQLTGVPLNQVVETKDPYRAIELVEKYDPKNTKLVFAVSEKDMSDNPRFKFGTKKDGSPTYLQPAPRDFDDMLPFEQHGYVMTVPTVDFTVLGEPMRSATEFRAQFAKADEKTQTAMITDLFGAYDRGVHNIMSQKIIEDAAGVGVVAKNRRQARDPRYSTSITVDVRPNTPSKNMKALRLI